VTNYFSHREELDLLLKQSKSISLFLGLHHIHFGIINALVLSALLLGLFDSKRISWSNVAMAMIIIGCFHILSSRTGLFSFYLSIILTGVLYAFKEKKYRILWLGTGTILLANVMAYSMSSSFRAKMENSLEDVQSWNQGEEINHKSMGMRLEAYRIAFLAAKEKPFLGHGAEEADSAMQRAYRVNHSVLEVENRIGPHNQYIEMGLKYGIPGFLYLFVFFLYWLRRGFRPLNYSILCWTLILTFSCIFESLMERQLGTIIMACSLPLIKEFGHDS
jgi:O-antigen ligase